MILRLATTLLAVALAAQAGAREGVVLEGRWTTERNETVCLVHEGDVVTGFDEPGSTCPDGTKREVYIENGKLGSDGTLTGKMMRCSTAEMLQECGGNSVWGPAAFDAPTATSKRISGTRYGEWYVDCKLDKTMSPSFSLARLDACDLDAACASIEGMLTAIDPARREALVVRKETLRRGLDTLREQLECLACEGRETRTQRLLGDLLREINGVPTPDPDAEMPLGAADGRCLKSHSPQECTQVKAIHEILQTLKELGGFIGCWPPPPVEGASPEQCLYNCLNAKTANYLIKRQLKKIKAVKRVLTGANCMKCKQGDYDACVKCVNGVTVAVPGVSEAVDIADCVEDCAACPENCPYEHVCERDASYCYLSPISPHDYYAHSKCTIRCDQGRYQWHLIHECIHCAAGDMCRLNADDEIAQCYDPDDEAP